MPTPYIIIKKKKNLANFISLFQFSFSVLCPKPKYLKDSPPSFGLISYGSGSVLALPLTSHQLLFKMLNPGSFSGCLGLSVPHTCHHVFCCRVWCSLCSRVCPARWRHILDGFAQTSSLPAASRHRSGPGRLSSPRAVTVPRTSAHAAVTALYPLLCAPLPSERKLLESRDRVTHCICSAWHRSVAVDAEPASMGNGSAWPRWPYPTPSCISWLASAYSSQFPYSASLPLPIFKCRCSAECYPRPSFLPNRMDQIPSAQL